MFRREHPLVPAAALLGLILPSVAPAALPILFLARPGEVLRLDDANADGDYLDSNEIISYAAGLSGPLQAICATADAVFIVDTTLPGIIALRDLNADGDCLDFGESALHADLSSFASTLRGLACQPDGTLLTMDPALGAGFRVRDLNADGDALDSGEIAVIAEGIPGAAAVAIRPDGRILAAASSAAVPVRILDDRDVDGDYLDFAENLSYAEDFSAGVDLAVATDRLSFLLRPSDARVLALRDLTLDDDALDFGEVTTWAEGLTNGAAIARADALVFVAANDAAGSLHLLSDENADGDALDFGEMRLAATGLTQPAGLAARSTAAPCLTGDLNADGLVNPADVPPFAAALLGAPPAPLCRVDLNQDTVIDARDIQPFVDLLIP